MLDDAEAAAFEAHLAQCPTCTRQLTELSGIEPLLATLAGAPQEQQPGRALGRRPAGHGVATPDPRLLDRLLDRVAGARAARRRKSLYLVAAAAVLMAGGPVAVLTANGGGDAGPERPPHAHATSPAEDAFFNHLKEKVRATDAATRVTATVGTEPKPWGTHTVLELKNVKGPLTCSLIAVGKNGDEETVTTWAVPKRGYGIKDSPDKWARTPLYVHGGAGMKRNDIDHFEVRTNDGKRLVEVDA
ncbi:zf-HC2 domain-containing protein [Streptomyces sp. NPDC002851]